jgi:hypothetical protein
MIYKVDSRRRTYAELWRQAPNLRGFFRVALGKLLGVQQPCTFGIRRPEALNRHTAPEVPAPVRQRLEPVLAKCMELNMPFQFYATVDATIGSQAKAYMATVLHADGSTWASATTVVVRNRTRPAMFNCFSLLHDGRYVVTSDHAWKLAPHPGDLVERLVGAPPEAVEARHSERLAEPGRRAVHVRPEELERTILTREQRHVDYQIERGVYVPMTEDEFERIRRKHDL